MRVKYNLLVNLAMLFVLGLLWACGGSDGGSSSLTESTTNTISGVASKGLINEGTVTIYSIMDGEKGSSLGTTTTDSDGNYSLEVEHDEAVLIEITGGTYTDEATGETTTLSETLRAALSSVSDDTTAAVTPLSEIAVRVAETSGSIDATVIADANDYMSQVLGHDIVSTLPVDCNNATEFGNASPAAQNYTLILAAISQMAETSGDSISDILDAIEEDLTDDAEMDETSDELLAAIDDFIKSDQNQTGSDDASELVDNIGDVIENGVETTYRIGARYLQYRNCENTDKNTYRYLFVLNKNGLPVAEEEIDSITITDADGNPLTMSKSGYWSGPSYQYDYRVANPTLSGPFNESDLWGAFESLDAGTYQVDILMANGDHLTEAITYPGKLELPVIQSSTMQSEWSEGALTLSWDNPSSETNWSEVDQIRVWLYDVNGDDLLSIKLNPTAETVTLPATLINPIMSLRDTGLTSWRIQTRAISDENMNYARGISNQQPLSYAIGYFALNYRTFEDTGKNRYQVWMDVFTDGDVADDDDFSNFKLLDSSGEVITPLAGPSFRASSFECPVYNCMSGSCSQSGVNIDSGFSAKYSELSAGTYQMTVDSPEGTLTAFVEFFGAVTMPVIPSSSVEIEESGEGDWTLTWTNPTDNWSKVDQIRFIFSVVYDGEDLDEEVLVLKVSPDAETVTISNDAMSEVESIISDYIGDKSINEVRIETRAYDENGRQYARGVSYKDLE